MSDLDLRCLFATLVDHFASTQTSMVRNPLDEDNDDIADLYEIFDKDGTDMGVTKFRKMNDQELMDLLDFPEGWPVLFAKYRHKDTMTTAWDNPNDSMWQDGADDLQPLRLLWHQLCGLASFIDGVFQRRGKRVNNRLLADDVGIGKSAQVMGMIAFLILVWFVEKDGKRRPPIIADRQLLDRVQLLYSQIFYSRTLIHGPGPCSEPPSSSRRPELPRPAMDAGIEDFFQPKANRDPSRHDI